MDIRRMMDYALERELKIQVFVNKVDIVNYTDMGSFSSSQVRVNHETGHIIIRGKDLAITRLLKDEVLITGVIKTVELG